MFTAFLLLSMADTWLNIQTLLRKRLCTSTGLMFILNSIRLIWFIKVFPWHFFVSLHCTRIGQRVWWTHYWTPIRTHVKRPFTAYYNADLQLERLESPPRLKLRESKKQLSNLTQKVTVQEKIKKIPFFMINRKQIFNLFSHLHL